MRASRTRTHPRARASPSKREQELLDAPCELALVDDMRARYVRLNILRLRLLVATRILRDRKTILVALRLPVFVRRVFVRGRRGRGERREGKHGEPPGRTAARARARHAQSRGRTALALLLNAYLLSLPLLLRLEVFPIHARARFPGFPRERLEEPRAEGSNEHGVLEEGLVRGAACREEVDEGVEGAHEAVQICLA